MNNNFQPGYSFYEAPNRHEEPQVVQPFSNHNRGSDRIQYGWEGQSAGHSYPAGVSTATPFNQSDVLATATHNELLGSGNKAYSQLYEAHITLKTQYNMLKETFLETKGELATTRQQVIDIPKLQKRQSSRRTIPEPTGLTTPPAPHSLLEDDYPKIPFWTRQQWQVHVENEKKANRTPNRNRFLTDSSGVALSKERSNRLWEDAKVVFNSLYYFRLDPDTWGKKTGDAANYVYNSLSAKHEEFQFCDANWKVQAWVTERYPDWVKNVRKGGGLKWKDPDVPISGGQKQPAQPLQNNLRPSKVPRPAPTSTRQVPPTAKASTAVAKDPVVVNDRSNNEEDDMYVDPPNTIPKVAQSTSSLPTTTHDGSEGSEGNNTIQTVTTSNNGALQGSVQTPPGQSVAYPSISSTTSPTIPTAGSTISNSTETPDSATNVTISTDPDPSSILSTDASTIAPTAVTPQVKVSSMNSPPTAIISQDNLNVSTPVVNQVSTGRPTRQKRISALANIAIEKPPNEVPKVITPATFTSSQQEQVCGNPKGKKGKALIPSETSNTARNLYMRDYVKDHPDGDLESFRSAFGFLNKETLKVYEARSKELKMAAKAGTSPSKNAW